MIKLSPTIDEITALRATMTTGPVVIINLQKFKPDGGKQAFLSYLHASQRFAPKTAEILYAGAAGADLAAGERWDFVAIVRYLSFSDFADFMCDPGYQREAVPFRQPALEKALFLITQPCNLDEYFGAPTTYSDRINPMGELALKS